MSVKIFGNGKIEGVAVDKKRIDAFTGSGTFVVPAGVTYAIAHMLGGGGGSGQFVTAGDGSASSVAFASGTVQSLGGTKTSFNDTSFLPRAGQANSGRAASNSNTQGLTNYATDAQYLVAGAVVTPAASITVTVGAGGAAGTGGAIGGSGYVYIEYFEEV